MATNLPLRLPRKLSSILIVSSLCIVAIYLVLQPTLISRSTNKGSLSIYFSDISHSVPLGQSIPVEIRLRTGSTAINAAQIKMKYDPRVLDIIKMNTDQSFCSFYVTNSFDTITGEVNLACGTPNPGFTGDSVLIHLTMRAKGVGTTDLLLDPKVTKILANDGQGTSLLHSVPKATITVRNSF